MLPTIVCIFWSRALTCSCALASRPPATYFLALEDSDLCARRMCGAYRGLTLHLKDASGADVLRCKRPFACTCLCGLPCCCFTYLNPQTMEIVTMAPGGMEGPKLGSVRQAGSCFSLSNKLEVLDAHENVIYILSAYSLQCGPNCCCHECACPGVVALASARADPRICRRVQD